MFQKLKLSAQLNLAFGIMIVLLSIVSIVAYVSLSNGHDGFVDYRTNARDSNLSSRIQANVLIVRLNAIKFLNEQNEQNVTEFNNRFTLLDQLIEEGKNQFTSGEKKRAITKIDQSISEYKSGFDRVVALYAERNNIVTNELDAHGAPMRKNLTQLIEHSASSNNVPNLIASARIQESLMLGRLYVSKFLINNSTDDYERALKEFENVSKITENLSNQLSEQTDITLLNDFERRLTIYVSGINRVHKTIISRNEIINNTLNRIGPIVADEVESIKLASQKRQDEIGPKLQANSERAITTILVFSLLIIATGVFLSIYIANLIKRPIGGEPLEIAKIAQTIAAGDLTYRFQDTGAESGIYLAMKDMVAKLNRLIAEIVQSTEQVSHTSQSLSAITMQSKIGAEQQMEQLTQTATAMHEMAATVGEITQSAQLAADSAMSADGQAQTGKGVVMATQRAMTQLVSTMNDVSITIENLEAETESVGSILDVIRGIADQTNLLALNAAIEAARAGEQGRGFAVVADEVRSLASRTQQSTEEIQAMISKLQLEAKRSVDSMRSNMTNVEQTAEKTSETGEALEEISRSVGTIKDMNVQIASASEEQNVVTQQISESVQNVNETAIETMHGAEKASQIALDLSQLASGLDKVVQQFKVR